MTTMAGTASVATGDDDDSKGHGGRDHWNNGHWRHSCKDDDDDDDDDGGVDPTNSPPEFVVVDSQILVGDPGVGGNILSVFATDADAGDTLVFSLTPEDGGESADAEFFDIDPATGQITLAQPIAMNGSEDADSTYEVSVEVTDGTDVATLDLDITFTFGG